MEKPHSFDELLARLRRGEDGAVREFVATYEPYIRRAIRPRLVRAGLRAAADSADICQSVLGSFLIRIACGEYELHSAGDLEKLLVTIARRKFAALTRREYAERRDRRRVLAILSDHDPVDPGTDPGQDLLLRDVVEQVRQRLADEERALFESRQKGQSWEAIARQRNDSAVLLRKRLSRALHRVAVELGLEDRDEGE